MIEQEQDTRLFLCALQLRGLECCVLVSMHDPISTSDPNKMGTSHLGGGGDDNANQDDGHEDGPDDGDQDEEREGSKLGKEPESSHCVWAWAWAIS